jgi:hypothetical protein
VTRAWRLAAVAATVLGVTLAVPADGAPTMTVGLRSGPTATASGSKCTYEAVTWAWERGSSGINRLRARFELRGPYDPGYLPTYAKSGWARSRTFPNNALSYWNNLTLRRGSLNSALNSRYGVWAKTVGERPSFWQRDVVVHWKLGDAGCDPGVSLGS